jgi:hypothetical protein
VTAIVAELREQPGDGITPVTSAQIAYTPIPGNVVVASSFDVSDGIEPCTPNTGRLAPHRLHWILCKMTLH